MTYEISYDLNKPGQDYPDLFDEIKKLGSWCHPVDSTWFVVSSLGVSEIRDRLLRVMDSSDSLVVVKASEPGAWHGLSESVSNWLKDNL